MSKNLLIGSLLAAVVLMVWGFVAWGLLADQLGIVRAIDNEEAVMSTLRDQIPESGAYFFPMAGFDRGTPAAVAAWEEAHTRGPVGFLTVRPPGIAPNMGKTMGLGLFHFFFSALLAGWIVKLAGLPTYVDRAKLIGAVGVFAAFALHLSGSIWWYVPWDYATYSLITTAIGWGLAGLVLARFVHPIRSAPALRRTGRV